MAAPTPKWNRNHPLWADRARLEALVKNMHVTIQRTMHGHLPPGERVLIGGESADDVLVEALDRVLCCAPSGVGSWEALGTWIARREGITAIRRATKGRHRTHRDGLAWEVAVLSLDHEDSPVWLLAADSDAEMEFEVNQQQLVIDEVAREILDKRDLLIFFDRHHNPRDISGAELGRELGMTGQRVGQIYREAAERVWNEARRRPDFPTLSPPRGRT